MLLRKTSIDALTDVLRAHHLTEHAFTVTIEDTKKSLITIKYNLNDSFAFNVAINEYRADQYTVTRSPGPELLTPTRSAVDGWSQVRDQLESWLRAVVAEDAIPAGIDEDVKRLKEVFFRELSERIKSEEQFFTKEEAQALFQRIETLEAKLADFAKGLGVPEGDVEKFHKKLETAKADVPNMTKRKWILVGGGKILDAILSIAKRPEVRKAIADKVAGYLS